MNDYLVPTGFGQDEFTEKRSRFIGTIWRCETEDEALAHIKEMNESTRGAAHNVYAYIIRENNIMRYSDNGEPQGTAGMPTLEVLRRENVTNVLCVVTRYFGGVLLGVGGLTRAYARSAKIALDAAGISRMRLWCSLTIDTPYNMQEGVRQKAVALNGIIENTDFGARVVYSVFVPAEETDAFIANIIDFTAGAVTPIKAGEKYMGVPV